MTRKQLERRKEKRRRQAEARAMEAAAAAAARRAARRARVRPRRFFAPQGRYWIMVRAMPAKALKAASELRALNLPFFEARAATTFVTARGQQRTADVAILRQTLFVGMGSLADYLALERCAWLASVLSPLDERGFGWIDPRAFRHAWHAAIFDRRPVPAISRADMQRFADHVTGHLKDDEKSADDLLAPLFATGINVRVKAGKFASFAGTVEGYNPKAESYSVAVNIFGRKEDVEIPEEALEAA
ncbi:transcription termination/antitermination protein NusG [Enterovirga aerilata]|uniref:Uncharacterized protein n=1 Tax=Enterovirga aerilata TaxID=2730920 RepID=A0A849ICP5_9HYPH|nr:hypothetical protein [Enterovirga sp. DB1703]NNM75041.1 hypothetical protein [Enterovirga sp. DB1703]